MISMKGQLGFKDPFATEKKREPVRKSDREHLLDYQGGKCWSCHRSFRQMGVRPILHHKNLNPKDNRITNMVLICSNCHDRIHQKEKKVRKRVTGAFGLPEYRVVKVGSKRKRRTTKKHRKRRESNPYGIKIEPIKLPKRLFL